MIAMRCSRPPAVDDALRSVNLRVLKTPVRAPQANAFCERLIGTAPGRMRGLLSGNVTDLFRPFEQRGADRTGLGLGLTFSRWGVETNHGRIHARNLPDVGCVFTVDLPRCPVSALATG